MPHVRPLVLAATLLLLVAALTAGAQPSQSQELRLSQLLRDLQNNADIYRYQADDYYPDEYEDENPGEVIMTRVRKGAGNCYARGKCLYYSKRLKTEFCGDCGRRQGCFPGDGTVLKETGETISMAQLKVGDTVLAGTRSGSLTFSPVVTWLDKRANHTAQYIQLATASGHVITLSANHVILVKQDEQLVSRFAGDVTAGDIVKAADSLDSEEWTPIVSSLPIITSGAYVPLTAEGTIVVDGVLASCYASFDHDWAHALTTPLRWLPTLFEDETSRDADGSRAVVERLKQFGEWLFPDASSGLRARVDDSVVALPLLVSGGGGAVSP